LLMHIATSVFEFVIDDALLGTDQLARQLYQP
jgi:hypothetical protein